MQRNVSTSIRLPASSEAGKQVILERLSGLVLTEADMVRRETVGQEICKTIAVFMEVSVNSERESFVGDVLITHDKNFVETVFKLTLERHLMKVVREASVRYNSVSKTSSKESPRNAPSGSPARDACARAGGDAPENIIRNLGEAACQLSELFVHHTMEGVEKISEDLKQRYGISSKSNAAASKTSKKEAIDLMVGTTAVTVDQRRALSNMLSDSRGWARDYFLVY